MSYSLFALSLFISESNTAKKYSFVGGFGLLNVSSTYKSRVLKIANLLAVIIFKSWAAFVKNLLKGR